MESLAELPHPPSFLCPILRRIMKDPVVASDGVVYERAAIEFWLGAARPQRSPMTGVVLDNTKLVPHGPLRLAIEAYMQSFPLQRSEGNDGPVDKTVLEQAFDQLDDLHDPSELLLSGAQLVLARIERQARNLSNDGYGSRFGRAADQLAALQGLLCRVKRRIGRSCGQDEELPRLGLCGSAAIEGSEVLKQGGRPRPPPPPPLPTGRPSPPPPPIGPPPFAVSPSPPPLPAGLPFVPRLRSPARAEGSEMLREETPPAARDSPVLLAALQGQSPEAVLRAAESFLELLASRRTSSGSDETARRPSKPRTKSPFGATSRATLQLVPTLLHLLRSGPRVAAVGAKILVALQSRLKIEKSHQGLLATCLLEYAWSTRSTPEGFSAAADALGGLTGVPELSFHLQQLWGMATSQNRWDRETSIFVGKLLAQSLGAPTAVPVYAAALELLAKGAEAKVGAAGLFSRAERGSGPADSRALLLLLTKGSFNPNARLALTEALALLAPQISLFFAQLEVMEALMVVFTTGSCGEQAAVAECCMSLCGTQQVETAVFRAFEKVALPVLTSLLSDPEDQSLAAKVLRSFLGRFREEGCTEEGILQKYLEHIQRGAEASGKMELVLLAAEWCLRSSDARSLSEVSSGGQSLGGLGAADWLPVSEVLRSVRSASTKLGALHCPGRGP